MEEKIKFIETKKNNLNEQAKTKLKAGDKNGARQALAKKKKFDEQIKQFDGALMLMEEQKMMLQNKVQLISWNSNFVLNSNRRHNEYSDLKILIPFITTPTIKYVES